MNLSENMAQADDIETLYMYCQHEGRCLAIAKAPDTPNHASIIISYGKTFAHLVLTPKEREIVLKALKETETA